MSKILTVASFGEKNKRVGMKKQDIDNQDFSELEAPFGNFV